ncbi:TonB-dependent receptor family protein [Pectobacterium versatile]|uniref:TonB-dependent receptor family protein n=1 Tax=Pectobacterium versatile TaxID=2488639 RepID=UPI00196924BA|nr:MULTISPECIES: TonB-dependent receptor [Pectobacterium]MBN3237259.1 TonB-dependent receptor [Pectobacterium versatile]MBQ4777190.1 TonB-dependent receptor [Pectobacterium versatile]MCL6332822.1 TonB-dependent receptor [Pectobacterium carotovorum subsp. carotovorum]MCL6345958.1 TonB-dependent receptor [Pectobacterium carotovorum subsp. carotovorum]MCL6366401.1 TonB-dependent receptor [Pectobacterium carotovorum subsp. carotovorum]
MKPFKLSGVCLSVVGALLAGSALAEEATDVGTINVQGQPLGAGLMVQEDSAKSRSTVTKDALDKMPAAGNAIDKLKYTAGLNVSSNDSSGLSGVSYTMRGMSADQVGLSSDGIPVNDSGDYAVYPNGMGDPENLEQIFVTQGSSEMDGPHIGASGGNIGLVSHRPAKEFGGFVKQTFGSNNLSKTFARLETGKHNGFSSWLSYSYTDSDKWRGAGYSRADKVEWNGLYEHENGHSSSLIVKYNQQDTINYSTLSKQQFEQNGRKMDYATTPVYNSRGQISQYYKLNRNNFETLNVTFTQKLQLRDNLALTLQPYYFSTNGGSFGSGSASVLSATSDRAGNYDLSNLTSNTYYRPSWTETWRPGITTKLKWDISDEHSLDIGYWFERARQRQTQPFIPIKSDGTPVNISGKPGDANQVTDANGNVVQGRNQFTVTPAHKIWVQDTWFFSPEWTFTGGLAYQHVERDGTNLGSLYNVAEKKNKKYHEFLPSFNAAYRINTENQVFYNITRNMRTPPNYVLYNVGDSINTKPELSWNQELGWRFQDEDMLLSASLFFIRFTDRQISSRNAAGDYEMINAGKVENKGLELEWSGKLPHNFNYFAAYTYTDTTQKNNLATGGSQLPTTGKQVANAPKNMLNLGLGYDDGLYYAGVNSRYVGSFYGDMTNDEKIGGRTVFDLSAGVYLPVDKKIVKSATLRFGVNNLFDKEYLDSARSVSFNSRSYNGVSAGTPFYNVGEERTFNASLEATF